MIVIAKDAEQKFKDDIEHYRPEEPARRCFYIRFSEAGLPKQAVIDTFLELLQAIPNSYRAQVYICEDADIFIVMHGFMQRQFVAFLEKLAETLQTDRIMDLYDILEIDREWQHLTHLCDVKLTELRRQREKEEGRLAQQEKARQKEKADQITMDVLGRLSPHLIDTMAERRKTRKNPLVMVVDDDQLSRTLVWNVIRTHCECVPAQTGREAILRYVEEVPDILFLDIGLPDIDGHQVLEHIFQIDPDAYVIMFSARKDKSNMLRALRAGAKGFVGKPFTREKLFHYIGESPYIRDKKPDVVNALSAGA